MGNFICKIANKEEMNRKWDYEIANHPGNDSWLVWKKNFFEGVENGTRICYYGILDGEIITEGTAIIGDDGKIQNKEGLLGEHTAYLSAFRTIEAYQGKGYFSQLYRFMEKDLLKRGFREVTLGVEPSEVKNMKIYFNWGFENYIKTEIETYPPAKEGAEPEKIIVNYYGKKLA